MPTTTLELVSVSVSVVALFVAIVAGPLSVWGTYIAFKALTTWRVSQLETRLDRIEGKMDRLTAISA